ELAGVVTALGYGTTGLSVGQRVFGLTDWYRDGTLAEYAAVEARNLAPLPGDVDVTVGASLPISGLTAWQGLFEHGRLRAGQSVLVHGAAGAVGSRVAQRARACGAYATGPGRAAHRQQHAGSRPRAPAPRASGRPSAAALERGAGRGRRSSALGRERPPPVDARGWPALSRLNARSQGSAPPATRPYAPPPSARRRWSRWPARWAWVQ